MKMSFNEHLGFFRPCGWILSHHQKRTINFRILFKLNQRFLLKLLKDRKKL